MPTFNFRCNECNSKFEHFSKTVNIKEDVNCPSCNSSSTRKVMSAPNISMNAFSSSAPAMPSCATGGCAGGMCGLN